jgi:cytochrome P450 family 144
VTELAASMLLHPAVLAEPYTFYRALHDQAPVWPVPGTEIVVVSNFAMVSEAVSRVSDFSSEMRALIYRDDDGGPARLSFGDAALPTLATADPPQHTVHRKAVFPELVARRMATLEADIAELSATTVRTAIARGSFDFMALVGNVVPITVVANLIGFRDSDPAQLLEAAFESTALLGGTLELDQLTVLIERTAVIQGWISEQIDSARPDSEDTILSAVRRALDSGTLQRGEAVTVLHTLLSAGGESTTSLLGNAVRVLAEQPTLQEHLRANPDDLETFIEEVLRLESPFRYLMRSAPRETTLGGVDIAPGSTLLLFWGAANRDPAEFTNAESIDLTRRVPKHHVAFGRGIHYCVGAPLARLEAHVVLTTLLEHTSRLTLDLDHRPRWADSLMVRRHEELFITSA